MAWSRVGAVDVNGVRLGYRDGGDPTGPPVLLLHGSGSNAPTWDRFAARLVREGYRPVAVDLRGHATSARSADYRLVSLRDDVLGVLDVLDLDDATLVGHSVGGYAALAAALHRPDRIARLVLEDVAAPPRRPAPMSAAGMLRVLAGTAGILAKRRDYELRAVASFVRQLSVPDPDWWARLGEVDRPTLILSGGPTSYVPPQRLAEMAAAVPGARSATIPVGHRVHSLAPEEFAARVLAFLAGADEPFEPLSAPRRSA
jgi:3-oxoadipate enol-lactonase